jgi:hypothetical protein
MATSETPQWLQIVTEKRKLRDDAIQRFIHQRTTLTEVLYARMHQSHELTTRQQPNGAGKSHSNQDVTAIDDVQLIPKAIVSGAVTASLLLNAYINR